MNQKDDLIKFLNQRKSQVDHPVATIMESLKCFWTYPFGHIWCKTKEMSASTRFCILCGSESRRGDYEQEGHWFRDLGNVDSSGIKK